MSFFKKFKGLVEISKVDDNDGQGLTDLPKSKMKKKHKSHTEDNQQDGVSSENMAVLTEEAHIEKQKEQNYKDKPTCMDNILFHETLRLVYVVILCLLIGLLIPWILTRVFKESSHNDRGYCGLNISYRMECLPGSEVMNEEVCYTAKCCYDSVVMDDAYAPLCFHAIPADYSYDIFNSTSPGRAFLPKSSSVHRSMLYSLREQKDLTLYLLPNKPATPHGEDAWSLKTLIQRKGDDVVRIKIWNPEREQDIDGDDDFISEASSNYKLDVEVSSAGHGFNITVKRSGVEIFNTVFGPLIFSENYTEITARISSMHLYGLGQRGNYEFTPKFSQRDRWALFNFDSDANDGSTQSSHPYYMNIESSGNVHGVYLKNSAPMELGVYPIPAIVFRTLGGSLDFRFFAGPTPHDVSRQYAEMIGMPTMPPYWVLGYHLCRTTSEPTEFSKVYDSMIEMELPYESDCVDARLTYPGSFIDLSSNDWNRIDTLKESGRKFWLVQYPFLQYGSDAYDSVPEGILLKVGPSPNSTEYFGTVGNETVGYPDYVSDNTRDWMQNNNDITHLYSKADGVMLFRNSPLNQAVISYNDTLCNTTHTDNCCPAYPMPFLPIGIPDVNKNTLCASVYHETVTSEDARVHMRNHNAYGKYHHQRISELLKSMTTNRTFVTSQSTHPGSGVFGGQFGGNYQPNLVSQQIGLTHILQMGLYGIPLTGMPICGNINNTNDEMRTEWCLRAHQMAAFLPFAMNHYEYGHTARNPPNFSEGFMNQIKYFIRQRYMLIPYMYTLFHEAALTGVPVARPLFYEFPQDKAGRAVMSQFLLGKGLMVTPVFSSVGSGDSVNRLTHFPPGCWYDFYKGSVISHSAVGQDMLLPTLLTDINVHLLGGTIIPLQGNLHDNFNTTAEARQLPFILVAALPCDLESPVITTTTQIPSDLRTSSTLATGTLYMDDGETPLETLVSYHNITFEADASSLTVTVVEEDCSDINFSTEITSVRVFGIEPISQVTIDGTEHLYYTQEQDNHALNIFNITYDWCEQTNLIIRWN